MDEKPSEAKKGYGKRPLWQWVLLYAVVGAIVYGAIYYFVLADRYDSDSNTGSSDSLY